MVALWIQKLTEYKGQYRVTIPKKLAEEIGADKWKVVVMSKMGKTKVIRLEEWKGGDKKRRVWGDRSVKD